ncbi:MAG: hypothetical protein ACPGUC_10300 [Gammaproteobacteria bacterium]
MRPRKREPGSKRESGSDPISRNISATGLTGSGGASRMFHGLLDEVYIFDNALNMTEISKLMDHNSLTAPLIVPAPALQLGPRLAALARRRSKS